jgi:hypothetical protein
LLSGCVRPRLAIYGCARRIGGEVWRGRFVRCGLCVGRRLRGGLVAVAGAVVAGVQQALREQNLPVLGARTEVFLGDGTASRRVPGGSVSDRP